MLIRTIIEFIIVIALIYGFRHEKEVVAWENKWFPVCRTRIKNAFKK